MALKATFISLAETLQSFQSFLVCHHRSINYYYNLLFLLISYFAFLSFEDIDECEDSDICPTPTNCINTPGSFVCDCGQGFSYHSASRSCKGKMHPAYLLIDTPSTLPVIDPSMVFDFRFGWGWVGGGGGGTHSEIYSKFVGFWPSMNCCSAAK